MFIVCRLPLPPRPAPEDRIFAYLVTTHEEPEQMTNNYLLNEFMDKL